MKQVKERQCKWCGIARPLPRRKRICNECKQQQFFKSTHWIWLESAAYKYGVQCWPDDTDSLVELLELRQAQKKASGWFRANGELDCTFKYELAHRYPASKGGKLIADNLVIMPMKLNRKMGDRHGAGLECHYKAGRFIQMAKKELRKEFLRRYDMKKLEGFAKANDKGSDFTTKGADVFSVINQECERLCFGKIEFSHSTENTDEKTIDVWEDFIKMNNKYNDICSTEKAKAWTVDLKDALEMMSAETKDKAMTDVLSADLDWMTDEQGDYDAVKVQGLVMLNEDSVRVMATPAFRVAVRDADLLTPLIDEQRWVYGLIHEERQRRNEAINNGTERWWG
ncbi:hypothetical protein AB6D33_20635 [Vibrio splendidus]